MYDPAVTRRRIERRIAATADHPDPAQRFHAVYHSPSEVDSLIDELDRLVVQDEHSTIRLKRPLDSNEQAWVNNERTLCTLDADYWMSRYAWINDDTNTQIRFTPRKAQRVILNVWGQLEADVFAIMMQLLKARQLGGSTVVELESLRRILFFPDTNGVVGSCDDEKSQLMFKMVERCWERQPWWLVPAHTSHKIGRYFELENGSSITVQSGKSTSGIARGYTPQIVHISELASFFDPRKLIDASLLHAVHPHAGTFLVLESTAEGLNNWWHKKWKSSVKGWANGTGRLCPLFLPWFLGEDIYPTATWLRMHPVPSGWAPSEKTETHAKKCALYARTNDRLVRIYGPRWEMPRHQQWFYECQYEEAAEEGRLSSFLTEMPSDPEEAFQSTNFAAVDVEDITRHATAAQERPPYGVFGVVGDPDEIPQKFWPQRRWIDRERKPLRIAAPLPLGSAYEFVPLKFQSYDENPLGRLYIFDPPRDGEEYGIGVDMGDGIGQDRSVCSVIKKYALDTPWVQAAEFASDYMNSLDFWPIVQAIASYYTVYRHGRLKQPKLVIECKANGEMVQLELKKRGWTNFHLWVRYDTRRIEPAKAHHIGVLTTGYFRRMMMDKILHVVKNFDIDVRSPWLVEEFRSLERDEERQQIRADAGGYDDRVMAMGFPLISLDALAPPRHRPGRVVREDLEEAAYTDPLAMAPSGSEVYSTPLARAWRTPTRTPRL